MARSEILGQLRQGAGTMILPSTIVRNMDEAQATGKHQARGSKGVLLGGIAAVIVVLGLGFYLFAGKNGEEVRITTDPPGAVVMVNGSPIDGTKPLILKDGQRVQLQKAGFESVDYTHKAGDRSPQITLKPKISEVTLQTNPPGAVVVLDSRKLDGVTPLKVQWNEGMLHDLTFTHPTKGDHLAAQFEVGEVPTKIYDLVPAGVVATTGEAKTTDPNAPGTVKFAGEFTVRVKVDGKDMGDVSKISLPPGSHKLELSSPRYFYKDSKTVNIAAGQTESVSLPGLSHLIVSTFPSSGTVMIDGVATAVESDGSTPVQVVKGKHTISIQGKGNSSHSVDVDKDSQELKFQL